MLHISDLDQFKATPVPSGYPTNLRTFYAPYDDVHGALMKVIGSARKSLVIEMYAYDDDQLAALVDGYLNSPGVEVQITLDKSESKTVHEAAILYKYAVDMVPPRVAIGTSEKANQIIHRKMAIVDGLWRISGSTNWSASGQYEQDNECTVLRSAAACTEARAVLDLSHAKALKG